MAESKKKEPEFVDGLEDLTVEPHDGAYALVKLGKEVRRCRQDDLVRADKKLTAAVQYTH